jgi:hypothetical protein
LVERDIWLTANLMVRRFGDDAVIESAMRADELSANGDLDGAAIWRRVISKIEILTTDTVGGSRH